jgi:hypothetical protein
MVEKKQNQKCQNHKELAIIAKCGLLLLPFLTYIFKA